MYYKKTSVFFVAFFISCLCFAQVQTVIKKTTLTVKPNTTIYFNGSVEIDSGTLLNNGTSVNTSDIKNLSGNVNSTGKFVFIGTGNSYIQARYYDNFGTVEINKSLNSTIVSLGGSIKIDTLIFSSDNKFYTGNDTIFIVNADTNAIQGFDSARYVYGKLNRKVNTGR